MSDDTLIDAVLTAIVIERQATGQLRMRCADRAGVVRALEADPKLGPNVCRQIEESVNAAKATA